MSTHTTTYLAWYERPAGLDLLIDHRRLPLPALLSALLLRNGGRDITDDPAQDLLELEYELRRYARHLASQIADATEEVAYARDEITLAASEHGAAGRHHRRSAIDQLAATLTARAASVDKHHDARAWITVVREFVINASVTGGPLADAAAGWQRSPALPLFVIVFDTERSFLDADPRRAASGWWGTPVVAGIDFGTQWRRDGDDDALDAQSAFC